MFLLTYCRKSLSPGDQLISPKVVQSILTGIFLQSAFHTDIPSLNWTELYYVKDRYISKEYPGTGYTTYLAITTEWAVHLYSTSWFWQPSGLMDLKTGCRSSQRSKGLSSIMKKVLFPLIKKVLSMGILNTQPRSRVFFVLPPTQYAGDDSFASVRLSVRPSVCHRNISRTDKPSNTKLHMGHL